MEKAITNRLSKLIAVIVFILSLLTYVIGASIYSIHSFYFAVILANIIFFITNKNNKCFKKKENTDDTY